MKKRPIVLMALILTICLLIFPSPGLALVNDGGDWDINGNWLEQWEAEDGSVWGTWIDVGGTEDFANATGDYYLYSLSLDETGSYAFVWDYNVQDLTEYQFIYSDAITGYYTMDYLHEDYTGAAGSFYKSESQEMDPLSGSYDNELTWRKDLDLDGEWWNDKGNWYYSSWDWYEAGEGIGETGYSLYNWYGGIREYDNSYTSISGSFESDSERYWDTDLDGNWYDNYYTQYSSSYDAQNGWEYTDYYLRDRLTNWNEYSYYLEQNLFSDEMYTYTSHRIDTDGDDSLNDYGVGGAYYSYAESSFEAYDQYSYSYYRIYDPFSHYYMRTESDSHELTGHMYSEYTLIVDTDGDGMYEGGGSDDYYYNEYSGYDSYDGSSYSETRLWDVPAHYYMGTNESSTATGSWSKHYALAVDTDGDGDIEVGSNGDDYFYQEGSGFDASNLGSWSNTYLWDIPNGYYYATEDSSNESSGHFNNRWYYASDTDNDDNIEAYYQSDDAYQWAQSGYNPTTDLTYSESRVSIDGNNNQDAYMWATENHYSRGNGYFYNASEAANLVGWSHSEDAYDIEDGPYTYQQTSTKVWGEGGYYLNTVTYAYDAGDHGTSTDYYQDTDGDTAWDNTNDYEIYSGNWDEYENGWHQVGYYVNNFDTELYTTASQEFSATADIFYFYEDDFSSNTGEETEMFLFYDSGESTPFAGYLTAYNYNGNDYEWIYFDGQFQQLPYPIGIGGFY